jgi:hypothetical protein
MEFAAHKYACIDKSPFVSQSLSGSKLGASKVKAAFLVSSIWDQPEIKIAFMDGTQKQKLWVQKIIDENLAPLTTKLKFVWNAPIESSDIRISFALPNQAWSTIGKQAKQVPKNQPTMNLGWIDDDVQFDVPEYKNTGQVVMHEFGHAMGMIHEHQNPKENPIVWNKKVVSSELRRTNGWSDDDINQNMFEKYGDAELCKTDKRYCGDDKLTNGSMYDVNSIMHYFYPQTWITSGPSKIPANKTFSALDKEWLSKYYSSTANTPEEEVESDVESYTNRTTKRQRILQVLIMVLYIMIMYMLFST